MLIPQQQARSAEVSTVSVCAETIASAGPDNLYKVSSDSNLNRQITEAYGRANRTFLQGNSVKLLSPPRSQFPQRLELQSCPRGSSVTSCEQCVLMKHTVSACGVAASALTTPTWECSVDGSHQMSLSSLRQPHYQIIFSMTFKANSSYHGMQRWCGCPTRVLTLLCQFGQ